MAARADGLTAPGWGRLHPALPVERKSPYRGRVRRRWRRTCAGPGERLRGPVRRCKRLTTDCPELGTVPASRPAALARDARFGFLVIFKEREYG